MMVRDPVMVRAREGGESEDNLTGRVKYDCVEGVSCVGEGFVDCQGRTACWSPAERWAGELSEETLGGRWECTWT